MRSPFRRRPSARRPRSPTPAALFAVAAAAAPYLVSALEFREVPESNLDLSQLGRIGLAGNFNGISLYEFEGQNELALSTNGSEALLARLPNGAFASIASTDASIHDMCASLLDSGEMAGVVIAGNFTSVDGTPSQGVALFNTTSSQFVPLDGLSGQVNALLCDEKNNMVYAGGNFRHANSTTNAIAWVHGQGWTPLPFAGFNGPVSSITKTSNDHIIFGGSFTGLGNTSTPTTPDGQIINLSGANVTAASSSRTTGFSDPRNILCKTEGAGGAGNSWLLEDGSPGFWRAQFSFGFEPTKLRLWNTRQDGRGTRTWRFTAFPINGILNMTYVDPATGQNATCTSECPLSNDPAVTFQDFHFINNVGMNEFRIDISEFYGAGGGLNGIQLFGEDIFAYAINDFNEPTCEGLGIQTPSTATATGPWTESPSLQSNSRYLTAQFSADNLSDSSAAVVFFPNIEESGNYSVEMYTPGCIQDDTCTSRGQVNVTGDMSSAGNGRFSTTLFQTNNFDKYDQIYFGYIEASSAGGFRPSVTLRPLQGQTLDNLTVVAQRVGFSLVNSTGGLNGLFDYDPSASSFDKNDFTSSAINQLGASFSSQSAVTSLKTVGDVVIVGGNFTSADGRNVVGINIADQKVQPLDGGLNGEVMAMHLEGSQLYVGGEFSNSLDNSITGLNNVGVYASDNDTWTALGAGVNGKVIHVVPMLLNSTNDGAETVVSFTGNFDEINEFSDNPAVSVSGFAIWVPSQNNWLQNLEGVFPAYNGVLTAAVLDVPDSVPLFAGSMSSATLSANGAVTLSERLGQFPVRIQQPSSSSSALQRRDILSSASQVNGVVTGAFYNQDDRNVTVLAGHFTATSGGSTLQNLVFINGSDNDAVRGIDSGVSENSTFVAVAIVGDTLFAGGDVSGNINTDTVRGLLTYNLATASHGSQPPGLNGGNGTVSAIEVRPETGDVYVGGAFESAGSFDCPGVCYYSTDRSQWNRPGTGLEGNVSTLLWASESRLIVGGGMQLNDSLVSLVEYDADDQTWTAFPGQNDLPGPVDAMTRGSQNADQLWVAGTSSNGGSVYLMKYDGSEWHRAGESLLPRTVIHSLQIFTVTSSHEGTDTLEADKVLMLTGSIGIPDFGTASAAIFNGTGFVPYALTTNNGNGVGTISKFFSQNQDFFSDKGGKMALVFVVLIGLAIAIGLMFLLVIAGILLDRLRKKREGYTPAPTSMYDRGSGIQRIPPHELLESLGKGRPGAPRI
ncbi:hypothetical protein ACHAO2_003941 [Verticillium nonalfalfae]